MTMAHVAQWKYKEVEELTALLKQHPVIGIAEIGSIPAPQMQQMRQTFAWVIFLSLFLIPYLRGCLLRVPAAS